MAGLTRIAKPRPGRPFLPRDLHRLGIGVVAVARGRYVLERAADHSRYRRAQAATRLAHLD